MIRASRLSGASVRLWNLSLIHISGNSSTGKPCWARSITYFQAVVGAWVPDAVFSAKPES